MSLSKRILGAAALVVLALSLYGARANAATVVSNTGVLALTSTMPDSVPAGTPATITLTGVNNTGGPITNAYVSIIFPKSLGSSTGAVSTVPGATCGSNNVRLGKTFVSCFFGDLPAGATVSGQFTVVPSGTGDLPIDASMNAFLPTGVGVASTYLGSQVIVVTPGPTDLQLGGSLSTSSPARGATYRYTYQVKDLGPFTAFGTTLSASSATALFTGATTGTGAACTVTPTTVACPLGTLANAGQATVTVTATAPLAAGSYPVQASVSAANGDTRPANNTSALSINVR